MDNKKLRDPALDIIRCVALFCVISVHFFLNTGFYNNTVAGEYMLVMTIMRNSFMICVPLFMMLSGYLIHSKEANKAYYIKIVRILYVYIIASIICALYRILFLKDGLSVFNAIINIFSFTTAPYSWYVEMYIGLFLLIPFLNMMYEGLHTQRKKQLLIVTLLTLTALPGVLNIYCIAGLDWWLMPSKASDYFSIVPDWWTKIYPITYFFLGKYLREFSTKLKAKQIAFLMIPVFLIAGIFNYYRSYGTAFIWGQWQDYGSLLITIQAVLVFCFFIKLNYENLSLYFRNLFSKISELSLGAYLTSWVFDKIVYARLNEAVPTIRQKLIWYPIVVIIVLTGSLLCSYFIELSYSYTLKKPVHRYINQIRSR